MEVLHFFLYILLTIFFIGLIILFHELGHFIAAKLFGVRVERFAFGLPLCGPIIFRKKIFDTEFIVHLLFFFGGYIAYPESNPRCNLPMNSSKRFLNKTPFQKSFITLAGIFMNICVSFLILLFIGIFWKFIPLNNYEVVIDSFKNQMQLDVNNTVLKQGDIIYSINNKKMNDIIGLQEYFRVYQPAIKKERKGINQLLNSDNDRLLIFLPDIYVNDVKDLNIVVIRDNEKVSVNNININKLGAIGVNISVREKYEKITSLPMLLKNSFRGVFNQFHILCFYIGELITGSISITDIRGIFSIIKISADLGLHDSCLRMLWLMSFLSLNMALINLFPVPVFDGGKFLIILSGDLLKKSVKRSTMEKIMKITFSSFNIIFLLIVLNDLYSIFRGIV